MTSFITSIILASQVWNVPMPQVIEQRLYPVPTAVEVTVNDDSTLEESNQWRVAQGRLHIASRPLPSGDGSLPEIDARTAIVMDVQTRDILWQKNPDSRIPIASITKLANALTWHALYDGKLNSKIQFTAADKQTITGSKDLLLPVGSRMTVNDVLSATLVGSYNDAAQVLARSTGVSQEAFLQEMNRQAKVIGMRDTTFADVTGLSQENSATAYDVAVLAAETVRLSQLQEPLAAPEQKITVINEERDVYVQNTDALLQDADLTVLGGKTGYTNEAGYCFVAIVKEPTSGRRVAIAVLGAPSDEARFAETKTLAQWAFSQYSWPK
jgi:D-alanyl-D-alanine carboxypeptidase (penicillin-binding protein 5/6)